MNAHDAVIKGIIPAHTRAEKDALIEHLKDQLRIAREELWGLFQGIKTDVTLAYSCIEMSAQVDTAAYLKARAALEKMGGGK